MVHIQDTIDEYTKRNAGVVGILGQDPEKPRDYLKRKNFSYKVLIDEDRRVIKEYGVHVKVNFESYNIARPSNFILDGSGIIRYIYIGSVQTDFPKDADLYAALDKLV